MNLRKDHYRLAVNSRSPGRQTPTGPTGRAVCQKCLSSGRGGVSRRLRWRSAAAVVAAYSVGRHSPSTGAPLDGSHVEAWERRVCRGAGRWLRRTFDGGTRSTERGPGGGGRRKRLPGPERSPLSGCVDTPGLLLVDRPGSVTPRLARLPSVAAPVPSSPTHSGAAGFRAEAAASA